MVSPGGFDFATDHEQERRLQYLAKYNSNSQTRMDYCMIEFLHPESSPEEACMIYDWN